MVNYMRKFLLFLLLFLFNFNASALDLYVSKRDIDSYSYITDCDFSLYDQDNVLVDSWVATENTHFIPNISSGSYVLVERPIVDDSFDENLSVFHEFDVSDSSLSVVLYNKKIDTPRNLGYNYSSFFIGCSFMFFGVFLLYIGFRKFYYF